MLGLIGEGTGIAAKVLKSMGEYTEHSCFPHASHSPSLIRCAK